MKIPVSFWLVPSGYYRKPGPRSRFLTVEAKARTDTDVNMSGLAILRIVGLGQSFERHTTIGGLVRKVESQVGVSGVVELAPDWRKDSDDAG